MTSAHALGRPNLRRRRPRVAWLRLGYGTAMSRSILISVVIAAAVAALGLALGASLPIVLLAALMGACIGIAATTMVGSGGTRAR